MLRATIEGLRVSLFGAEPKFMKEMGVAQCGASCEGSQYSRFITVILLAVSRWSYWTMGNAFLVRIANFWSLEVWNTPRYHLFLGVALMWRGWAHILRGIAYLRTMQADARRKVLRGRNGKQPTAYVDDVGGPS